jgi:hypothetical protein
MYYNRYISHVARERNYLNCIRFEVFHGSDYEECRLLGYKTQFVPDRRHITSPLESPAS